MKKDMQTLCIVCKKWFILSDPSVYETNNGINGRIPYEGVCKNCWILIGEKTSWINHFREKIKIPIFEYEKVKISPKTRWKIWKKDNFTCQICGSRENLSVDHIVPEVNGGSLKTKNLRTLCRSCNSKKNTKLEV